MGCRRVESGLDWMSLLGAALGAGTVAVLVTVAIERWGGQVGGLLGTLPSTIVPAAAGIYAQSSPAEFASAMWVVPPGMLLNAVFLWLWRVLPARLPAWSLRGRLAVMSGLSVLYWLLAATGFVLGLSQFSRAVHPWVGGAGFGLLVGLGLWATRTPHRAPAGQRPVPVLVLVMRGLGAGCAIGIAVWLSSLELPLVAGVASVFPAIFVTTMVSLWLSQGEAVPIGAVGPMMLGSTSVAGFAVLATFSFPALGPVAGALTAWGGAALLCTGPAFLWLQRRT